jgi:hypothetical protein
MRTMEWDMIGEMYSKLWGNIRGSERVCETRVNNVIFLQAPLLSY